MAPSSKRLGSLHSFQIYFALFLLLATLVQSVAVPSPLRIDPKTGKPEEGQCDVVGNPDLYGLGVRLGIYFQWIGSWLSNMLLPDEISSNLDANAIFLLALFVAVAKGSFDSSIGAIDALVLLILAYGYFFSVLSLFGYRTRFLVEGKGVHISVMGTYLRLALTAGISGFAVWFWFEGIESLPQAPCDEVIFFFASFDVLGPIRIFYQVAAVCFMVYYGSLALVAFATIVKYIFPTARPRQDADLKFWEHFRVKVLKHDSMLLERRSIKIIFYLVRVFNAGYLLFAAITVEMTLNWNRVSNTVGTHGLSGVGQQLPAMIGAFTFLRVLWLLFKENHEKRRVRRMVSNVEDVDYVKMDNLDRSGYDAPVSPIVRRNADTSYKRVTDVKSVPMD